MADSLIYVSRLLTDRAMAHLKSLGVEVRVGDEDPPSRAELEESIAGAGAAVVTLTERVDAALLAAAGDQLKVVANVAVGYDNIDLDAAEAAGVTVTNTPGVLDRATADHTFALILAATRRVAEGDRFLRSREPWVWGPRMLVGLDISAGATLGILGYGRIGRAVAKRAQAFDMTVVASARSRRPGHRRGRGRLRGHVHTAGDERRRQCAHATHARDAPPDRCHGVSGDETDCVPDQYGPRRRRR